MKNSNDETESKCVLTPVTSTSLLNKRHCIILKKFFRIRFSTNVNCFKFIFHFCHYDAVINF